MWPGVTVAQDVFVNFELLRDQSYRTAVYVYFLIILYWDQAMVVFLLLSTTGPPIKRRAGLRIKQAGRGMEATSVTQLLKSFCDYSHWRYAVFWKLNHHSSMTLTWEDGYFGYRKTNEAEEGTDASIFSSSENPDVSGDYSVQLLMTEMSHLKYTLGEGIVGKIALSGDHCWLFCEDIFTSKFNTNFTPECPYEWLLQLASGIKTIVLIPISQGVLQFGSYEAVAEDLAFVANIRQKFNSIHRTVENTSLCSDMNLQDCSFSFLTEYLMENLDESSHITKNILEGQLSNGISLITAGSTWSNPTVPLFVQDEGCMSGVREPESIKSESENGISLPSSVISNYPRHIGQLKMTSDQMVKYEIQACSEWVRGAPIHGDISNGICYWGQDLAEQFDKTDTHDKSFKNVPVDSELHRAPGHLTDREAAESILKYFSVEDTCSNSILNAEYLLEAVVGNLCSASDDTSSSVSNSVISPVALPDEFTTSIQPIRHSEETYLMVDNSNPRSHVTPAFVAKGTNEFTTPFTPSSFDGNSSILIDRTGQEFIFGQMQSNSGQKLPSAGKKKNRVGNTQRSRPRDRQLIMDRMKELRELVPDGGRCSIDNLLDRTIKHMLYLRSITSKAEKLKKCVPRQVPECKRQKNNGSHAGRSCAFDFKSENQVCPIVIEDLECSGHMLIEMVCSEHGLFLEIAQVIKRMELTILKGVLESRSSTTWAHFIVEVPRGFHRMDVLCPLLHLLQLRRNPVSSGL
ncbi:hypothetical protein L6164_003406 [Bauhinia variegata]|uniref:Uncharacterized protein n=1 Tax=Bauhinia variegata TaxID=167791 RepID=A0ACB9Q0D2_BAUVA|nr:hypothetical protein L6164_003406 [Bauhinia variegata]